MSWADGVLGTDTDARAQLEHVATKGRSPPERTGLVRQPERIDAERGQLVDAVFEAAVDQSLDEP